MNVSKRTIFYLAFICICSCATAPVPKPASEYLLSTDKSATSVLSEVRQALEKQKYKIKVENVSAGLLATHPRGYSYQQNGATIRGRHTIQLRQEGGSVKVRVVYQCKYKLDYEKCLADDKANNEKVRRIDSGLVKLIRERLSKHDGQAATSEPKSDVSEPIEEIQPVTKTAVSAAPTAPPAKTEATDSSKSSDEGKATDENWDEYFTEE